MRENLLPWLLFHGISLALQILTKLTFLAFPGSAFLYHPQTNLLDIRQFPRLGPWTSILSLYSFENSFFSIAWLQSFLYGDLILIFFPLI